MLLWNNWEHSSYEGREQGQADCRAAFPSQWSLDKQCSPFLQQGRDLCWETSAQVKDYTIALN